MALLLRNVNKPKWVLPEWIEPGEVPADVLLDLRPTNNELSVWRIAPNQENLDSVLTAYASVRDRLDKLDYTLIDEEAMSSMAIRVANAEATTAHLTANSAHCNLTQLTVNKVARLAHAMLPLVRIRVPEKQIKKLLMEALRTGALDRTLIKPDLLTELEPPGEMPPGAALRSGE